MSSVQGEFLSSCLQSLGSCHHWELCLLSSFRSLVPSFPRLAWNRSPQPGRSCCHLESQCSDWPSSSWYCLSQQALARSLGCFSAWSGSCFCLPFLVCYWYRVKHTSKTCLSQHQYCPLYLVFQFRCRSRFQSCRAVRGNFCWLGDSWIAVDALWESWAFHFLFQVIFGHNFWNQIFKFSFAMLMGLGMLGPNSNNSV